MPESLQNRPRIAMIGVGHLGGGKLGQGIPVIAAMIKRVCLKYDVVFYSLIPVVVPDQPPGLTLYTVTRKRIPHQIKYVLLLVKLLLHHIQQPFDLFYAISPFPAGRIAVFLSRVLRKRVVIHLIADEMVAIPEINYGELLRQRQAPINQHVCLKADAVVVLSEYQRRIVLANLSEPRNILVLPLRIGLENFDFIQRHLSFPVKFVHVAYYHPVKDQRTLFLAFAKIAGIIDCSLTVIGDWFDNDDVKGLLKELDIVDKVEFEGIIANAELQHHLLDKHILLHSSRYEAECAVVMEAMASGIVVCGTAVGFLADHPGLAKVVSVADHQALADAALALCRNPLLYAQMQKEARAYIEKHSADWSAEGYTSLFHEMID